MSFSNDALGVYGQDEMGSSAAPATQPSPEPISQSSPDPAPCPDQEVNPAGSKSARSRCGRKPFGFYSGEDAIIQKMVELRSNGIGYDRLAELLNRESVPTRSGKPWHGRVVNRILKSQLARK